MIREMFVSISYESGYIVLSEHPDVQRMDAHEGMPVRKQTQESSNPVSQKKMK